MHMADALISPAVGGTLWVISGSLIAYCSKKVKQSLRDNLVPMMGVLGAFIFTAQMINFSIPGTGSSGHIGGGLILAALLGPHAAFLVVASVLTIQSLFFADGGLLALGCNIFNLGFFPAFIAYPLIYKGIARGEYGATRGWIAAVAAAVAGLQMGAFSVVLETKASGMTDLPFGTFVLLMQPVHLAIGVVEGLVSAIVIAFVAKARPEAVAPVSESRGGISMRAVLFGLAIATVLIGGVASWFASTHPDGLEWSIAKVTGTEEVARPEAGLHKNLAELQEKTAFLPDYGFKSTGSKATDTEMDGKKATPWPSVSAGTSLSGLVGGMMTLALACIVGFVLRAQSSQRGKAASIC